MIIMRLVRTMIQYGMASIPVMIGSTQKSATGDMLHMCCTECDSKVSQKNFCSNESCSLHEVIPNARNSTNRYIDLDKENRKILKQEELKAIKEEGSVIQVLGKVSGQDIPSLRIQKSWYCVPDDSKTRGKKFIKPWASLRDALYSPDYVARTFLLVKMYSRGKEKLCILTANSKCLILYGIVFQDEVNAYDPIIPQELTEDDKKMGKAFVDSLKEIEISSVINEEREKLFELLEGKLKVEPKEDTDDGMDFLKVSA